MSTSFQEHLRLCLLRFLEGAPAYRANSSILHTAVDQFGLSATRDQVKTELRWLGEQNLVRCEELLGASMLVVTLTERGLDVSTGRAHSPGVQKPAPRI